MPTTTRLKLPHPVGSSAFTVAADLQALAEKLDVAVTYDQGTLANRPAAGTAGRLYRATDLEGVLFIDTGTAWAPLTPQRGTLAARPLANVVGIAALYFATDDHGGTLYLSTGSAWQRLTSGLNAPRVLRSGTLNGVASYTFTGLDGNVDGAYRITVEGALDPQAAAVRALFVQPNGDGSAGQWFGYINALEHIPGAADAQGNVQRVTGGIVGTVGFPIAFSHWATPVHVVGEATLGATTGRGLPAGNRLCRAHYAVTPTVRDNRKGIDQVVGEWENVADNITSLRFNMASGGLFYGNLTLERIGV